MEQEILEQLKKVIDPELMVNIVDLGLVYNILVSEKDERIEIEMTLTTKGCPLGDAITTDVESVLMEKYNDYEIFVELVWDPAWTPDYLTAAGREALSR